MKKILLLALGVAVLGMLFAPTAQAASKPFYAIIGNTTEDTGSPVYVRYFSAETGKVNPGGADACTGTWDPPYCQINHTNKSGKVGYKGYLEDIFNFDGNYHVYQAAWDTEFDSGTPNHRGYYAWMAKLVQADDTDDAWAPGCSGTRRNNSCLGSSGSDEAAGSDIENTPQGTLAPWGGLKPIPVPLPQGVDGDVIHLQWEAATCLGDPGGDIQYDLYYVVKDSCDAPTADEFTFLKTVTGTTTDVTAAELGINPDDPNGVFFALKLRYPTAGDEVVSRYFSANSQCIAFGGIAVEVVDIQAKWLRRNQVQVSWATELEDGVKGFYVLRGFTPNGPFERVSDLVPANGEPSKYTFIDTITPRGRVAASGLFYKIEAIDYDEGQKVFGPAQAELPSPGGTHKIHRGRKGFRF